MKKILVYIVAATIAFSGFAIMPTEASAALGYNKIAKIGNSSKTYSAGTEFELEVKKGSRVKDSNLWWSIGNTNIVKFDDNDRSDEEIELKAVKAGTTKVYCKNKLTGGKITYTITVKKASNQIYRNGSATRTVSKGNDFELEVLLGKAAKASKVKWTIANTAIVGYDDDDRYDDEMEFYAKKAGTTKIYANNLLTGGAITYTVTVKEPTKQIYRSGSATRTVSKGAEFELEVLLSGGAKSEKVKWTIADSSIIGYDDDDIYDDEMEFYAKKTGTTKIYANNLLTGGAITYTVIVK